MCFKRGVLLLSLLLTTACGLNVGENAPPAMDLRPSMAKYACVGEIAKKTELYIHAQMNDEEINSFISCLQGAIYAFTQYMHGQKDWDSFTPIEIRNFIQDNLLPPDSPRISNELLHQFMLIKQNLVGGGIDRIQRSDLEAANKILEQIRIEVIRMRPFIPILNPRLVAREEKSHLGEKIAQAEAAAQVTSQVFGRIMSTSQKPYSFKDFESFLHEFRKFSRWEEHFPSGNTAQSWTNLISAFKAVTVSKGDQFIQPADWIPLFQYAAQWYLNYIKFNAVIRPQPVMFEGRGLQNVVGWTDNVMNLLSTAVANQSDQMISYDALDRLLYALKGLHWLPNRIGVRALSSALKAAGNRILGPQEEASNVRSSPGITKLTIANLAVEVAQWQEIQFYLQEKYSVVENRHEQIKNLEDNMPALKPSAPASDTSHGREAWDRLIQSFEGEKPLALFAEGSDRVYLTDVGEVKNGFFNMTKMNLLRSVTSLIFRGYATTGAHGVIDAQLSQDQLQAFYQDFRDLGIDLGMTDRRSQTAGKRTFLEGKLFTYLSDGVSAEHPNLTFAQTMEEAAFLYSGGQLSKDLYRELSQDCELGPLDIYGHPKIRRSCVRKNLVKELLVTVKTMPSYTQFLKSLGPDGRMLYGDTLLRAAFNKKNLQMEPNGVDFVELSELATMAMVVHYSEAVMTRYNTELPHDDVLTEQEVSKGLSVFRDLALSTMAMPSWFPCWKEARQALAENGFKFVLRYGYMPVSKSDTVTVLWHASEANPDWGLRIDRQALTQVFATLIQRISDRPQATTPVCK